MWLTCCAPPLPDCGRCALRACKTVKASAVPVARSGRSHAGRPNLVAKCAAPQSTADARGRFLRLAGALPMRHGDTGRRVAAMQGFSDEGLPPRCRLARCSHASGSEAECRTADPLSVSCSSVDLSSTQRHAGGGGGRKGHLAECLHAMELTDREPQFCRLGKDPPGDLCTCGWLCCNSDNVCQSSRRQTRWAARERMLLRVILGPMCRCTVTRTASAA
jgi:hypothetical protein